MKIDVIRNWTDEQLIQEVRGRHRERAFPETVADGYTLILGELLARVLERLTNRPAGETDGCRYHNS